MSGFPQGSHIDAVRRIAEQARLEQGLPESITDPYVIARLSATIRRHQSVGIKAVAPRRRKNGHEVNDVP